MSEPPPDPFEHRHAEDGVYAECYDEFSDESKQEVLAHARYKNLTHDRIAWTNNPNNLTTSFTLKSTGGQFSTVLFGEILGVSEGTGLGCLGGTQLMERSTKQIDTHSKVRDKIVLGVPTGADESLKDLFFKQIKALKEIEQNLPLPGSPSIKKTSWVKFRAGETCTIPNAIIVSLPFKYAKPAPAETSKLSRRPSDKDVSDSRKGEQVEEITYDPSSMPDFNPALFDLGSGRLAQQKMYIRIENEDEFKTELVPQPQVPSVFAPGAFVVVNTNLFVFHFLGPGANHNFQLLADGVILRDKSPFEYKPKMVQRAQIKKQVSRTGSLMFEGMLGGKRKLTTS